MSQGPGNLQLNKWPNVNVPGLLSRDGPEAGNSFLEVWNVNGNAKGRERQ